MSLFEINHLTYTYFSGHHLKFSTAIYNISKANTILNMHNNKQIFAKADLRYLHE